MNERAGKGIKMIDLYTWSTTNGRRPLMILEETGIPYRIHPVNIRNGEQKTPEHVRRSPSAKIPAMVDPEGPDGELVMFESTAILAYLADKAGRFNGGEGAGRHHVAQWLQFSTHNLLPTLSIMRNHDILRPTAERLLDVLDDYLDGRDYLADDYSIADMSPMTRLALLRDDALIASRGNVKRWVDNVTSRPAIARALADYPEFAG